MATAPGRLMWRRIATLVLVGLLVLPVLRDQDGIPLSTYPMYATPRADNVAFVVPYGVTTDGLAFALPRQTTASTVDPLVAESTLTDEVNAGRGDSLCQSIARRVADDPDTAAAVVEVRVERHDVVSFATSGPSLLSSTVVSECVVP